MHGTAGNFDSMVTKIYRSLNNGPNIGKFEYEPY